MTFPLQGIDSNTQDGDQDDAPNGFGGGKNSFDYSEKYLPIEIHDATAASIYTKIDAGGMDPADINADNANG